MKNKYKLGAIAFIALLVMITLGIFVIRQDAQDKIQQPINQQRQDDAPVLDYEVEIRKTLNGSVLATAKKYNSQKSFAGNKPISELPPSIEPLPTINHWYVGLSALPVNESNVIVIGRVVKANAHLSEDKTRIYSEFSIQPETIFKNVDNLITLNKQFSATRSGGSVRFVSGRINKYRISRQGMPQINERYLLFLQKDSVGNLEILTAYQLRGDKVFPLDGEDNPDPRTNLPFSRYRNAGELGLIEDLKKSLQK